MRKPGASESRRSPRRFFVSRAATYSASGPFRSPARRCSSAASRKRAGNGARHCDVFSISRAAQGDSGWVQFPGGAPQPLDAASASLSLRPLMVATEGALTRHMRSGVRGGSDAPKKLRRGLRPTTIRERPSRLASRARRSMTTAVGWELRAQPARRGNTSAFRHPRSRCAGGCWSIPLGIPRSCSAVRESPRNSCIAST